MKKLGVIGCGALSNILAKNISVVIPGEYEFVGFFARTASSAEKMAAEYGGKGFISMDEMLVERPDIIIEMASGDAVKKYGTEILAAGIDLIIISIGALADVSIFEQLKAAAIKRNSKMYVVNGAVGGFDVLQTMALMNKGMGLEYQQAEIENIKAPASLNGAAYLAGRSLSEEMPEDVFCGDIVQAITGFPKNVNVAVASALAAEEPTFTVAIKSQPGLKENKHIIRADNDMVRVEIGIYSKPDPQNPKSSTSTAWSVLALLKNLAAPIVFY